MKRTMGLLALMTTITAGQATSAVAADYKNELKCLKAMQPAFARMAIYPDPKEFEDSNPEPEMALIESEDRQRWLLVTEDNLYVLPKPPDYTFATMKILSWPTNTAHLRMNLSFPNRPPMFVYGSGHTFKMGDFAREYMETVPETNATAVLDNRPEMKRALNDELERMSRVLPYALDEKKLQALDQVFSERTTYSKKRESVLQSDVLSLLRRVKANPRDLTKIKQDVQRELDYSRGAAAEGIVTGTSPLAARRREVESTLGLGHEDVVRKYRLRSVEVYSHLARFLDQFSTWPQVTQERHIKFREAKLKRLDYELELARITEPSPSRVKHVYGDEVSTFKSDLESECKHLNINAMDSFLRALTDSAPRGSYMGTRELEWNYTERAKRFESEAAH